MRVVSPTAPSAAPPAAPFSDAGLLATPAPRSAAPTRTANATQPGRLEVAPHLRNTTAAAGSFRVTLQAGEQGGAPRLVVTHIDRPEHPIALTVPGEAFLTVAHGDAKVSDRRGHLRVRDRRTEQLRQQTVDTLRTTDTGSVLLAGSYRDDPDVRWQLRLEPATAHRLRFESKVTRSDGGALLDRTTLYLASDRDERFHGFGMQGTFQNLKGHLVPIVVSEQGIGRGRQPLTAAANLLFGAGGDAYMGYASLPHYVTSRNRSTFLENAEYATFDMRRPDRVAIDVHSGTMRGQLVDGATPKELVSRYTEHVGRVRELPDWVNAGVIIGTQGGTDAVRGTVQKLREAGVPLAGVWMQDWTGRRQTAVAQQLWWNWELDHAQYPDWQRLRAEIAAPDGARVLTYVNPMLVDVTGRAGTRRNLFAEALERGFLVKGEDGNVLAIPNTTFTAGLVDLSNPDARAWYKLVVADHVRETGSSGFMADYGEALPFEARMWDGSSGTAWHSRYADEWAKLVREALDEAGMDDVVAFHRSGSGSAGARSHAALQWSGDQLVTWDKHDGLRSALTTMLSGGVSGFALSHADTGGYTTVKLPGIGAKRSPELLRRWTELSAFTPMLRTHEGSAPDANAQVWDDAASLAHLARMAKVFAAIAPYRREVVAEASRTGVPVMRQMWLEFPDDEQAGELTDQYMLGADLLVAPVMTPGARSVRTYLPAGEWVHVFTGERLGDPAAGSWVEVDAPIGTPAVLARAGSAGGASVREALVAAGLAR